MDENRGLGQQALDKVAEVGIASQLRSVEELNVQIDANALQLVQGEVEAVTIEGEGLVMQKDLRVEQLQVQTGRISINPLAAAFGQIELEHPTKASARVLLTEADLNRSFNSEYIRGMLQGLKVEVEGKPLTVDTREVAISLPGESRMRMQASIAIRETGENRAVTFNALLVGRDNRVRLEDIRYEGEALSPGLTEALVAKANDLGNISNFELDGMSLRLQDLTVGVGQLSLAVEIYAEQFPG